MRGRSLLAAALVTLSPGCETRGSDSDPLDVFAAASLSNVAAELAADFESRHESRIVFNIAASNTLAQQIVAAPRADVFLSADVHWVDFLASAEHRLVRRRQPLLTNRLVVVAHPEADSVLRPGQSPEALLTGDYRFLAVADPEGVPAGRYARAYLEDLETESGESLWSLLSDRLVPTLDVRAALALVESDPKILGIVYWSDTLASPGVRIVHAFEPLADHPIVYWAATLDTGDAVADADDFLDYLAGPAAREIIARHGFTAVVE